MTTIGRTEWLGELNRVLAKRRNDRGLTSHEIAAELGICQRSVMNRLRLVGPRLRAGRKYVQSLDGRTQPVACYWMEPEPRKAKPK